MKIKFDRLPPRWYIVPCKATSTVTLIRRPVTDSEQSADELGLLAGHRCYENGKHEDCPYPPGSPDEIEWLSAWLEAFESAEANDV